MTERLVAAWSEHPFTGLGKRRATVEHRILVEAHDGVGVDVRHEVRCRDLDGYPSAWTAAAVFEARSHGIQTLGGEPGWWA